MVQGFGWRRRTRLVLVPTPRREKPELTEQHALARRVEPRELDETTWKLEEARALANRER